MLGPWYLHNLDSGEELQGQFGAENLVENNIGSSWVEKWSLNRANSIAQFAKGITNTVSFTATFVLDYALDAKLLTGNNMEPSQRIATLKAWAVRDEALRRPPILMFWVGDSSVNLPKCFIESVANVKYEDFQLITGKPRYVTVDITLKKFTEFSLDINYGTGETRYHFVKTDDYHELLCEKEYGHPEYGTIIRDRHPDKLWLEVGDRVKLPSFSAIEDENPIKPFSLVFKTAFGKKQTASKILHEEWIESKNVTFYSHII